MQIKTTVIYHLKPVRKAVSKKTTDTNVGEDKEKREPLHTVDVNMN
jgi:hypothetical protein